MSQYGGISYQFNFLKMHQNVSIKTEEKTVYINSLQIVKNAFISIKKVHVPLSNKNLLILMLVTINIKCGGGKVWRDTCTYLRVDKL